MRLVLPYLPEYKSHPPKLSTKKLFKNYWNISHTLKLPCMFHGSIALPDFGHLTVESCNIPDVTPPTKLLMSLVPTRTLLRVGTSEHLGTRLVRL